MSIENNPVAFFEISQQTSAIRADLMAAISRVVDSGAYILGPDVQEFENEFAAYFGSRFAISCASGSDALLLALMVIGVGSGDEVIVPSFTYYASVSCIQRLGATPIFVDCDQSYNMSFDDLEHRISPKTKAIIPVHLFGQMVDMRRLQKWASSASQKVYVIEDCAQSIGAKFEDRSAGVWGDIGTFSFYPTKNLGALGDAGLITAQNQELAERIKVLRVHGEKKKYYHEVLGINSRMDTLQAACLRIKLRHLEKYETARIAIAEKYHQLFEQAKLSDYVILPIVGEKRKHVWNQFTIRARDRERLMAHLKEQGVGTNVYYPIPQHLQKSFAYLGYRRGDLHMSERIATEVLSLPIYPELAMDNVERVVSVISDFYRSNR